MNQAVLCVSDVCSLDFSHYQTAIWLPHLHPEEGDAGEKIHGGLEVMETRLAAGREVVLQT